MHLFTGLLFLLPVSAFAADVVIVGSTPAGIAAAVSARRQGAAVTLAEPSAHVGGRFSEALGFDEEGRMQRAAIGGLWSELRRKVDAHYGRPTLSPEPHVHEALLEKWLADEGITVLKKFQPKAAFKNERRITSVQAEDGRNVMGTVFVDATYMGDVLPLAGVKSTVGREAQAVYKESLGGVLTNIENPPGTVVEPIHRSAVSGLNAEGNALPMVQAKKTEVEEGGGDSHLQCANLLTCLTKDVANRIIITKPANYREEDYELLRREIARLGDKARLGFGGGGMPNQKTKVNDSVPVLVHWGMVGGGDAYPTATPALRREIWASHRDYTQGLLWFLQNDAGVPEPIRKGMQQWGLPKDEFTDNGHWPYDMYAREGRRMAGTYVVTQRDLFDDVSKADAIALGCFPVDSHVVQRLADGSEAVINEGGYLVQPPLYQVPYRALTPKREECVNLLVPVALSCSRVAYNSLRVEPTWMAVGEASGIAAAMAAKDKLAVQEVDVARIQAALRKEGLPLDLPEKK